MNQALPSARPSPATGPGVVFWFRQDLRLHDQPALHQAIDLCAQQGGWLLPVFIHDPALQAQTPWGFDRVGPHRQRWQAMALDALDERLRGLGSRLLQFSGPPAEVLAHLLQSLGHATLICEAIAAPQEEAVIRQLQAGGRSVQTVWQSTLMAPQRLPFAPEQVPDHFTAFRQAVERAGTPAEPPLPAPVALPALPPAAQMEALCAALPGPPAPAAPPEADARSSFPLEQPAWQGSEAAALAHVAQYCARGLPHSYKQTRHATHGLDYSTKWSAWLASGALSARQAWAEVADFEARHGASESSGWIRFELLWRDHFRWLHRKHGVRLYRAQGLSLLPPPSHDAAAFARWCQGQTGHPFIDAGMRELARTGYLSNRLRQNVASYLIHDLGCDWRAGAAWFESRLIDFDVYSNQGNWLYLSGRGTDPRGSRRFNPDKQARDYDPQGLYRQRWAYAS
ncbi:MAG: DASH family cryptochrome [Limnohabitans sp.]